MILTPGSRTWRAVGTATLCFPGLFTEARTRFTSGEPMLTVQTRRDSPPDFLPATWCALRMGNGSTTSTAQSPREHLLQADKVKPWRGDRVKGCTGFWVKHIRRTGRWRFLMRG